jgi:hypothetical protein
MTNQRDGALGIHALIRNCIGISLVSGLMLAGCAPPEQSDDCIQYVSCQKEYDDATGSGPVDVSRYEADGACWFSPDAAAICTQECIDGLAALRGPVEDGDLDAPSCR